MSYLLSKTRARNGAVGLPLGARDLFDDLPEDVLDADPLLGADLQGLGRVEADDRLDLLEHFVDSRHRQIDLVDDRNHDQVAVDRRVSVGDGLRLHALKGVDEQQGPLARGQAAGDFVMEVDVPRRVDQVELVFLAVERVMDRDGPGLDRDAAVPLDLADRRAPAREIRAARSPRF